ncbi:hypothetical protein O1L68_43080 [Streptomyces lydicus]|nr:hypothetical protein [Streptomyces lydicus]
MNNDHLQTEFHDEVPTGGGRRANGSAAPRRSGPSGPGGRSGAGTDGAAVSTAAAHTPGGRRHWWPWPR